MEKNKIITLIDLVFNFIKSIIDSVRILINSLIWKKRILKDNIFLDVINFIFQTWPKMFWKKPTAIKIWRSISTLINYIFYKEEFFREVKKVDKK